MILSNNGNIIEKYVKIKDIPCILLRPKKREEKIPTIIFYHGWSSNKENQKFRGGILASLGYQVIIPDSIYHGERNPSIHGRKNPIDYNYDDNIAKYFWKIVLNNIKESEYILDDIISKYNGDPDNIGVTGHSMGGFTAAGVFTHDDRIKTGIPLNGSFNWEACNEIFAVNLDNNTILKEENEIKKLDPMNNMDKIIDRPILMLNGGSDEVVPMGPQKIFYEEIRKSYENKSKIRIRIYKDLGHFVTTNMMEDLVDWLNIYLK